MWTRYRTGTRGPILTARFAMTDVVRLWTAEEAKGRFVRTDIDNDGAEDREAKTIVMPSVFNMGAAVKDGMVIE
ncbi:hypothetical protein VTO73DRAFT_10840 [Trametes versicolor]